MTKSDNNNYCNADNGNRRIIGRYYSGDCLYQENIERHKVPA